MMKKLKSYNCSYLKRLRFYTLTFKNKIIIFLIIIIFSSCIRQPEEPIEEIGNLSEHGVYVLCEGLFGQNNSSISRIDDEQFIIYHNFLEKINSGFIFGDTGNDLNIKGDTAFVIVSTNKKIIVFHVKSGKLIKEIYFEGKRYPRKLAFFNDSLAAVSDLYDHSISIINTNNLQIITEHIYTGPAPEGIAVYENYLFVANSGYGDYLSKEPKAGTISVIDFTTLKEIKLFENVPNVVELKVADKSGKLYARYNNLPKYKDSLGGIVEFDINNLIETRKWKDKTGNMVLSNNHFTLYYLNEYGLNSIDLLNPTAVNTLIIPKINKQDIWYALAISPENEIWIGNAKNYQSQGEILIYQIEKPYKLLKKFPTGLNPNTIVFF